MTRGDRLYEKRGRWYGDFRDYSEVGGRKEALIPDGARRRRATTDRDEAMSLAAARLEELQALTRGALPSPSESPRLTDYAKWHLKQKAHGVRPGTLERDDLSLRHVVDHFGDTARLSDITVQGLAEYLDHRRRAPGSREGTRLSAQTLRHELTALSSLFKRALSEGTAEYNPVTRMVDKPRIERGEAIYLEVDEAAQLIKAAFEIDGDRHNRAVAFAGPLIATFAYTGGRRGEVFGLEVRDIDLENRVVHIRENGWRKLKRGHHRTVPLWPKLRSILKRHIENRSGLIFPAENGGMLVDVRGTLALAVAKAEIDKPVTVTTLRHTYGATRIQTLDHGAPIPLYTVARELGHGGISMVEKHYGHLQDVRHRKTNVEFVDNELKFRQAKSA